ncbi:hypothetical protein ACLKA7_017505 [Drosophila subpalustris]
MPIQAPSWTDFLNCPICCNEFAASTRVPISLGCGHTICKLCLTTLYNRQCPFDQTLIVTEIDNLPINYALLQLVGNGNGGGGGGGGTDLAPSVLKLQPEQLKCYKLGKKCIEELALLLKSFLNLNSSNLLTRPMQRKLVTLVNCQLMEEEGRVRALRAARSLGERTVTELILQHQNPQQLSSNLWAAVRTRGCQFLGPAMQEEVLKLVLLALEEGSALSRKVLVMFVVQRLEPHFPQASKTSIGHVVQLLYRASCFKVSKREADSSLMQLKEEFRTYDALRREHDAQIVQIATEAGLRIAPEQWSSLLYGDIAHKSHMQSIIDKLQTPSSFAQSVQELVIALQRTSDPAKLSQLHNHLQHLASIDACAEAASWEDVAKALDAVRHAVMGLVHFLQHHGVRKPQDNSVASGSSNNSNNTKYKISLCRDLNVRRVCPRGASCTFAHSQEEVERYRARNRSKHMKSPMPTGKKTLPINNDIGSIMPISPIRYMQAPPPATAAPLAPPAPHRNYLEPVHPPLMHPTVQQQQLARFEPRYLYGPSTRREFPANASAPRNPPNFNPGKSYCSMLPADVYQAPFFANNNNNNNGNNNGNKINAELPGKLLVPNNPGAQPWEHAYLQQQLATPSSKNPSRSSISTETADTSFYDKKPPSNVNLELIKPLNDNVVHSDVTFRSNSSNNNNCNNNNNSSLLFWSNPNKDAANFVRSDSILDDDATTFDVPTGSAIHSRYGPICPKRSSSNWNNWLMANDTTKCSDSFSDRLKAEHTTDTVNPSVSKNSAGRDNGFIWNSDASGNSYWSSSGNDATASGNNERLKQQQQQQLLDRKPLLLSEDSFEGGIDSGMMIELEKNLVDIVEVWSNPDDSGIKLD